MSKYLESTMIVLASIIIAIILLTPMFWLRPDDTTRALKQAGYTEIELTGVNYFSCQDNLSRAGFRAKGPTGILTEGTVCSGLLHGKSIRLD